MKSTTTRKRFATKETGSVLRRLMAYITGTYRFRFFFVIVTIIISSFAGVASSLFLKTLIDGYIAPLLLMDTPDFGPLLIALAQMAGIYLTGIVTTFLYSYLMVGISQGVLKRIRDDMFAHMQSLPIGYFDSTSHGEVMSRYTNDTDTLLQMISESIPMIISSLMTVISVIISMFVVSIHLSIFVLFYTLFMMWVTKKIGSKSGRYFVRQQTAIGALNGYIEEMLEGQKVVKVFNHEQKTQTGFDALNEEMSAASTSANTFANIMMPLMNNLGAIQYAILAIGGGLLVINGIGGLSLGGIAAFLQLSRSFSMPMSQTAQQANSIIMALAGAKRIFDLLDQKPEQDAGDVSLSYKPDAATGSQWFWQIPDGQGGTTQVPVKGDVRFHNVDFGYTEGVTVLHDVNLYAEPGQKVAFVGSTGAGKTTITNLINRFYDLQNGSITYDGIDISRIKKSDLRTSLGMVLQDTHLFSGTIRENIRYGRLDASDEDIYAAAKLANADSFISMMPQGYDTPLSGDGSELSQGQRQLLSIARAAVANPPVLILDEATSSIDTRTEAIVQAGMDALMEGRTVFVIAHRLSTVRNSNVIMVLEQGRIIERGTHQDLLEQRGRYYQLYTGAFELE